MTTTRIQHTPALNWGICVSTVSKVICLIALAVLSAFQLALPGMLIAAIVVTLVTTMTGGLALALPAIMRRPSAPVQPAAIALTDISRLIEGIQRDQHLVPIGFLVLIMDQFPKEQWSEALKGAFCLRNRGSEELAYILDEVSTSPWDEIFHITDLFKTSHQRLWNSLDVGQAQAIMEAFPLMRNHEARDAFAFDFGQSLNQKLNLLNPLFAKIQPTRACLKGLIRGYHAHMHSYRTVQAPSPDEEENLLPTLLGTLRLSHQLQAMRDILNSL